MDVSEYEPTDEQRRILNHNPSRHARVLAGPGTGKSATLVALIGELVGRNPESKVRLLTFTRAATADLARAVSEHPATQAERPSTIHSFSISVLLKNPGASDLPEPLRIADDWEYKNIVRPRLAARARVGLKMLDRLVKEMAAAWENLESEEDPGIDAETRARFVGAWREHREIYGYTLLQELPYALRQALIDHHDLRGIDYQLLIVDEYQDLNACDLDVLRRIADLGSSLIGAGDDDQSIYSFRKAAPAGIRRFPDDYPESDDYPLSESRRCGSRIIEWASFVIEGDPDRPLRPRLRPAEGSPDGDVALLSFGGQAAEARGIARLVARLVEHEGVSPSEILILIRTDYRQHFSRLFASALSREGIEYSDPESVPRMLGEVANRRLLASFRLLENEHDSLAWATLLHLRGGIGATFVNAIYTRALDERVQFGEALLSAHRDEFPAAPRAAANRAKDLIDAMLTWVAGNPLPDDENTRWGDWIVRHADGEIVPRPTDELEELLVALDDKAEIEGVEQGLGRYLGQIWPLGKDRALSESNAVRIMTMGGAKGLTVRATIVAALEDEIVPRPEPRLDEERRLLYVALTRAREFVYGTWATRRTGPTARVGGGRVQTRRSLTRFLRDGPVVSEDGATYLDER